MCRHHILLQRALCIHPWALGLHCPWQVHFCNLPASCASLAVVSECLYKQRPSANVPSVAKSSKGRTLASWYPGAQSPSLLLIWSPTKQALSEPGKRWQIFLPQGRSLRVYRHGVMRQNDHQAN